MKRKKFRPPTLQIDYDSIIPVENHEAKIMITDELLQEYKLQVDREKIDNFKDINFVSIFEE